MANHTPFPISVLPGDTPDPELYTGEELRQWVRSLAELSHGFIGSRTGVQGATACKVQQRGAGPTMSVDILSGRLFVYGGDSSNQGVYWAWSDTTQNIAVPVTPSGTRTHRIAAQLRDRSENGSWSDYGWQPVLLADTGSGTPALPATYCNLALVQVASTDVSVANAAITDLREVYSRWTQVSRATDSAARNSTTSLTDDDTLVVSNLAVGTHKVRCQVFYHAGSSGNMRWAFRVPPGATGAYDASRYDGAGNYLPVGRSAWGDAHQADGQGTTKPTNSLSILIEGTLTVPATESVVSGGGGLRQLAFQWAQWSSASIGATVEDFSSLVTERIG